MSKHTQLKQAIETAWEARDTLGVESRGEAREAVEAVLEGLDQGTIRVAEKLEGKWQVHAWVKQAILLSFRLNPMELISHGPSVPSHQNGGTRVASYWYDKVASKFLGWGEEDFSKAGFRAVPGCYVRRGSFIGKNAVLMPSFVNLGAYVDEGTMVDTWATVGSCAQVGKNCHISGGAGIGGVLEPLQAGPVILEDRVFIGARSEVAEGVVIEEGAVLAMGVFIGASTKIVDRKTGTIYQGRVPAYSVVVPGTLPGATPEAPSLACAVIVKTVDEKTRSKTGVNEILRGI